ncbi:hypothetical protein HPB48_008457 [Haemaphysalis longicornis]|uniref:Ig-like domain-containing protein n=1 Tax=Haemaphysalis longicornis TaxID=44386 RepID=A0A9J6FPV4_HAELO|nr:hypothetical protein HPB48_008457 [Haemaphysalis longicornis]
MKATPSTLLWAMAFATVAQTRSLADVPKPQSFGFSTGLSLGDEAVATCLVKKAASPEQSASLSWLKDGRPVTLTDRVVVVKASQYSLTLAFREVLLEDVGNYTCVAEGPAGRAETVIPLVLHGKRWSSPFTWRRLLIDPHSFGFPPNLGLGDEAIASCFVKSGAKKDRMPTLSWSREGRELVPDHRVEVHKTSGSGGIVLSIRNVRPEDVGNYTCTSWSPDGSRDVTVPLVITVKRGSVGPHALTWLRDGARLGEEGHQRVSVSRPSDVMSILAFKNIQADDVGNYTCVAANAHGEHRMTAYPDGISFQKDLVLGDSTVVLCALGRGSRGPHSITWWKGDDRSLLSGDDRVSVHRVSDLMSTLTFSDIGYEDVGNYTCVASNAYGSDQHTDALLVSGVLVKSGEAPYDFRWRKDGSDASQSERLFSTVVTERLATLTVRRVVVEDSANYTCVVSDATGAEAAVQASLTISGAPRLHSAGFSSELSLGEDTSVTCFVKRDSSGPYAMAWYKDGQAITSDGERVRTTVKGTSITLSIDRVDIGDIANYTCTAKNAYGSDTLTLLLLVSGPPKLREFAFPNELSFGEEVIIGCVVKKGTRGPYHISWWKDGEELHGTERIPISARPEGSATLRIISLRTGRRRQLHLRGQQRLRLRLRYGFARCPW